MTWNYRVLKKKGGDYYWFSIYSVFYNDEGEPLDCSKLPAVQVGDSPLELIEDLQRMLEAVRKPVLSYDNFPVPKKKEAGTKYVDKYTPLVDHMSERYDINMTDRAVENLVNTCSALSEEEAKNKIREFFKRYFGVEIANPNLVNDIITEIVKEENMTTDQKVAKWFEDKGLNKKENRYKQLAKATEEMGELAGAIAKEKHEELKLELGDVAVTLIGLAGQHGTTLEECLSLAYEKISKRKGETRDGVFVKEGD